MRFEDKVRDLRIQKHKGFETEAFLQDVTRLASGELFEYLMGSTSFCDAHIDLSLRPMVPRKETEDWVLQAYADVRKQYPQGEFVVLDLFSGSGCIAVSCAKQFPQARVHAADIDPRTKETIQKSCTLNGLPSDRIDVEIEDIEETCSRVKQGADIIFAVPPYVPPNLKSEVMEELTEEDEHFFFDKEDGYYYHKLVLHHASSMLCPGGLLFLECDLTQVEIIPHHIAAALGTIVRWYDDSHGNKTACAVSFDRKSVSMV